MIFSRSHFERTVKLVCGAIWECVISLCIRCTVLFLSASISENDNWVAVKAGHEEKEEEEAEKKFSFAKQFLMIAHQRNTYQIPIDLKFHHDIYRKSTLMLNSGYSFVKSREICVSYWEKKRCVHSECKRYTSTVCAKSDQTIVGIRK